LALFGRRPSERVERPVIPAAENLHSKRLMHCSKRLLGSRPNQRPAST
jgi:hypothetical protein